MSSKILSEAEQRNLLRSRYMAGHIRFLVLYDGIFHYAMICEQLLDIAVFFMINGESVNVPFSSIIMPGEPGMMRSIFVKDPKTGQLLVAKFVDFHNEIFSPKTNIDILYFKVIIRGDESDVRVVSLAEIVPKFPTQDESLGQEEMFKRTFEEPKARRKIACFLRFPLALPREKTNHVRYPFLEFGDLLVLYRLCQKYCFEMGYNYLFNQLIIRFQACGPQEKFFHEVLQLTASEEEAFKYFQKKYNEEFMGTTMVSNIQRSSKLTVQQVFLAQFDIAKALKVSSQCALSLPSKYFTDPEPEVVLSKDTQNYVPHSTLK